MRLIIGGLMRAILSSSAESGIKATPMLVSCGKPNCPHCEGKKYMVPGPPLVMSGIDDPLFIIAEKLLKAGLMSKGKKTKKSTKLTKAKTKQPKAKTKQPNLKIVTEDYFGA